MSPVALLAVAIIACLAWCLLPHNRKRRPLRTTEEGSPLTEPGLKAALVSRGELAEKNHTVKMAILQAELAVSSEARALEFALQLARHRVEHEDWMAGLTPQGRELYRQSKADLESAVGPTKVGPAGIREPSKFLPPEYTGDEWVDRQIEVGWRRQSDRRRKVFQSTSSSLRAEPKLAPFVKDELTKLGREDVWAQVNY